MSEFGHSFTTILKFSGIHTGAAGAKTSFLADAGPQATVVEVTNRPKYPAPALVATTLRVRAITNALAATLTITVMKNGSATAITTTIGAGVTTLSTDAAHAVSFAAGDELDLQLDSTAGGAGNSALLVATLEAS